MSINLLPRDYQKNFIRERVRRLIAVLGAAIFLVILVNIGLISPLWIFLSLEEKELSRQLDAVKSSPAFGRVAEIEKNIEDLNEAVNLFKARENDRFRLTPALESVIKNKPDGVKIESFYFSSARDVPPQPPRISVFGKAQNREALILFTQKNNADPFFSSVQSPISNLLKDADFDYSLILDIAR